MESAWVAFREQVPDARNDWYGTFVHANGGIMDLSTRDEHEKTPWTHGFILLLNGEVAKNAANWASRLR